MKSAQLRTDLRPGTFRDLPGTSQDIPGKSPDRCGSHLFPAVFPVLLFLNAIKCKLSPNCCRKPPFRGVHFIRPFREVFRYPFRNLPELRPFASRIQTAWSRPREAVTLAFFFKFSGTEINTKSDQKRPPGPKCNVTFRLPSGCLPVALPELHENAARFFSKILVRRKTEKKLKGQVSTSKQILLPAAC